MKNTIQQLVVEQSLLIDKQNAKLKEILNAGIYTNEDVANIITAVLVRIKEKSEKEVEGYTYSLDEKENETAKRNVLNAIWFSVSAVKYKDLLNIKE
jgi:hypothetical protein